MIKRYMIVDPNHPTPDVIEHANGAWVRYNDIQKALKDAYELGKKEGERVAWEEATNREFPDFGKGMC